MTGSRRRRRRRRGSRSDPAASVSTPSGSRPLPASQSAAGTTPIPTTTASQPSRRPSLEHQLLDFAVARARLEAGRRAGPRRPRCGAGPRTNARPPRQGSRRAVPAAPRARVTSTPSRRAVAATSWPMNPAPTTTRLVPGRGRPAAAGRRRACAGNGRWATLEVGKAARAAPGGDQQLLVAEARPVIELEPLCGSVEPPARRPRISSISFSSYQSPGRRAIASSSTAPARSSLESGGRS